MEIKARDIFLTKLILNGFAIEDLGRLLTMKPRGAEATAEVTIAEAPDGTWHVTSASGNYVGWARGKKRTIFENYVNRWAAESVARAAG